MFPVTHELYLEKPSDIPVISFAAYSRNIKVNNSP